MQSSIYRLLSLLILLSFLFTACNKEDVVHPQPPVLSNLFQFAIVTLPGEQVGSQTIFDAIVSVVDKNNDTVIKNRKLPLQFNGKYLTSQLELPPGEYRLVRLRIIDQNKITKFAAPMIGSLKAAEVNHPLSLSYSLPQLTALLIPVEVASVSATDIPQNFGYPEGSFEQREQPVPDEVVNTKIKLQASIQIGDIVYDQIPAMVQITITDKNGQLTTKNIELVPGENEVLLPKNASRFQFRMTKWGVVGEFFLDISQVREGELYGITGRRDAKKLKTEVTHKLANGQYVVDNKTEYHYNTNGQLNRIDYLKTKQNGNLVLDAYELLHYTDGKVSHIQKMDKNNTQQSELFFTYDGMGQIKTIQERNNVSHLNAIVTHYHTPNRFNTSISYTYSHSDHTLAYNMIFLNGNLEKSTSTSSLGNSAVSGYQYDDAINPFIHLQRPDLYLSGHSKNNVITQRSTYFGSYPQTYPYKFDYTYDTDGYPKDVIKYYKVPATNADAYTLKTVYTYL